MRQILARMCLLGLLLPFTGCGASSDAPPKVMSDAEKKQKMEESKAAMEKGMKAAEEQKGTPPGG